MRNRYRLDRTIDPLVYDIELTPNLASFTFTGRETITIRVAKPVSAIVLHAIELTITRAILRRGGGRAASPSTRIRYDENLETATIEFGATIPTGRHTLELEFTGAIGDKMRGFYRTSYEVGGRKRWGGATQFEATDARRAFPCWDEPNRKAEFRFALTVPRALTALSNMPIVDERAIPGTDLKRVRYAPTPRMSTYLLAWVIADLECLEGCDKNGVPIRIWTTVGKQAQGAFALEVGKHSLEYFAKWFGIRYSLSKLDMVALPDFASGAMENWGLVTYRETALLVDPKNSSAQAKQRVAEVIAHELAHQWFGNLVTMEWWTDLWLNEGFASYMGPKAVDAQFPGWQIWSQFVAGEFLAALHDDSLKNSHPIEIPVRNPHEIRAIFDHITYSKGSSVNRMLEHYLTEKVFRKGLSVYLKRYRFGNAKTGDLWAVLEEVSGKPVKAIMASFTKQEGYPVVTVKRGEAPSTLELTQRRFLFDGSADRSGKRWSVPIVTLAESVPTPSYGVLRTARDVMPVALHDGWVKVNAGQSGFYRTAYAPELLAKLARAIAAGALPPTDCLGVVDDAFALARAGEMRTSGALDLVASCGGYTDYNVWLTVAGVVQGVEQILTDEPRRERLARVARGLFAPLVRRLGWDRRTSDGHLDALLRPLAILRLGIHRDQQTIDESRRRFAGFLKTGELLPDIRGAVFTIVAKHGGEPEHEQLLGVYRKSPLQEERVRVLRALTFFEHTAIIRRVLDFSLSDDVRKQDAHVILAGFGHNRIGRHTAWEFVKAHWATLTSRYSDGGLGLMTRIIQGATGGFTTPEALKDVRAFFARHPVPGTERTMKQCLEVIQATIRWRRRDRADIERWLRSHAQLTARGA